MTDTYACGITMHRPEADLYGLLGIDRSTSIDDIARIGYDRPLSDDQRYAWKALSDRNYKEVYDFEGNTKALYDAGFFDDKLEKLVRDYRSYDPSFRTTNLQKVRANLVKMVGTGYKRPVVLVTTGGMAPIHNGHIEMMERAREVVEKSFDDRMVVGGFFAPGHDSYVSQKYNGTAAISAVHRCAMVELATRDSDWLEVDPWAARYMPAEINFTDVIRRMELYLLRNLGTGVDVFYVFGDDNAGFKESGLNCIAIKRTEISSKLCREGDHSFLNADVAQYFQNFKSKDTGDLPYLIRNEEDEAIKHWAPIMPGGMDEITRRRIQLQSTVRLGIAQVFKSMGHRHKVHLLPVSEQREKAAELIGDRQSISLDPFYEATARLDSTRYFQESASQFKPLFRDARIGFKDLDTQAQAVPSGDYVLVEDDSVTGETINSARMRLGSRVNITDVVLLSDFAEYPDDSYYDVVDLRDFIVGSREGGLSVIMPSGQRARAPYALPYVSLRSRAKIPPAAEMEISRVVWQANVRFFANSGITIEDASEGLQFLASQSGWPVKTSMEEYCKWHAISLLESV